ncbi:hypothetical protein HOY82DRAFT_544210 [Tuber indicum]|nr:hypothetical protein HOY82DRAFT_544210 [Tuber indicum]
MATQNLWRAFSKGMSGVVLNLLFGLRSPVYTVPELVSSILEAQETGHIKEAVFGTIFTLFQVTLHDIPTISFSFSTGQKLNLVTWVLSTKKEETIEVLPHSDFALNSISVPISQLASLFWPGTVMSVVISGLIRLWNIGAVYGRLGVSLLEATCLLQYKASKSLRPALQVRLKSEYDLSEINHVVLPFETPHSYYLFVWSIKNKQVTLFNWLLDGDIEDWLKQTTYILSMLPLFQGWSINIKIQYRTDTQKSHKKR